MEPSLHYVHSRFANDSRLRDHGTKEKSVARSVSFSQVASSLLLLCVTADVLLGFSSYTLSVRCVCVSPLLAACGHDVQPRVDHSFPSRLWHRVFSFWPEAVGGAGALPLTERTHTRTRTHTHTRPLPGA